MTKEGTLIHRSTLHLLMQKYGKKAGIPEYKRRFHVLKHTRAMHLLEGTRDIVGTKDWLGPKTSKNTVKYVQILGMHRWGVQIVPRLVCLGLMIASYPYFRKTPKLLNPAAVRH